MNVLEFLGTAVLGVSVGLALLWGLRFLELGLTTTVEKRDDKA